jgi:hypothetical protein
MTELEKLFFFKRNVPYTVGTRLYIGDTIGKALTDHNPYVAIKESGLRDFKRANRIALMEGLIIETGEPGLDEESPNAISDEQAEAIVKNLPALKKALAGVTSAVPVYKLLEEAKFQKRKTAIIELIEERLKDFVPEDEVLPDDMQSAY